MAETEARCYLSHISNLKSFSDDLETEVRAKALKNYHLPPLPLECFHQQLSKQLSVFHPGLYPYEVHILLKMLLKIYFPS